MALVVGRSPLVGHRCAALGGRLGRGGEPLVGGRTAAPQVLGRRRPEVLGAHRGPYETACEQHELITEVRFPIRARSASAYEKVERRVGDWAVAAVGARVCLDGDTIVDAGIGLAAVGAEHFAAPEAEAALRGQPATEESFREAGRIAAEHCNPSADQRGPVDYKRHLAEELTRRALRRAVARARGES